MLKSLSKLKLITCNISLIKQNERLLSVSVIQLNKHTIIQNNNNYDIFKSNSKKYANEWKKILTTAEKVVGYPTSFLNLRYLISDEVANFASLLRKLMLTNHPLIDIAKSLINEPNKYNQMMGLIILLASKASGVSNRVFLSSEISDGIHQTQRTLAEISEMINMAFVIHRGIMDLSIVNKKEYDDINNGNRIAVLCGDFLLAKSCTHLAKLRNTEVVEIISQVIADTSQIIFLEEKFKAKSESLIKCWYEKAFRLSSSLLANSCRSTLLLVNHSKELQTHVWDFANNLDISHKIWLELNQFKTDDDILKPYTLLNAIYCDNYSNINISNNKPLIAMDVFRDCTQMFDKHYNLALNSLNLIRTEHTNEDAMESLKSILNIMKTSIAPLS